MILASEKTVRSLLPANAGKRIFPFLGSQAGVFHVVSRIYDRKYLLEDEAREIFLKVGRAYEDLLGVEVLTHCVMSNHFHLLVRVPHRPADFDLPLKGSRGPLGTRLGRGRDGLAAQAVGLLARGGAWIL